MIYTEVGGRCGNQFFSYAISRKLESMYGKGITFNFNYIEQKAVRDKSWRNELQYFKTKPYFIENKSRNLIFSHGNIIQIIVFILYTLYCKIPCRNRPVFYHRQERLQPILNKFGIYNLLRGYSPLRKTKFRNQFVCGTYEDVRWFSDLRKELISELQPCQSNYTNPQLLSQIEASESVCVSFRGGDFLNEQNRGLRDICSIEYYKNAISEMKSRVPNARFIFFSDDIEWVKNNFKLNIDCLYENGNEEIWEKVKLMSSCKHFIMSNSTFCWWAQYLSTNENKIVISPDHWFNMPGYKHQLIDDNWVLLKCGDDDCNDQK